MQCFALLILPLFNYPFAYKLPLLRIFRSLTYSSIRYARRLRYIRQSVLGTFRMIPYLHHALKYGISDTIFRVPYDFGYAVY